jgi:hypothetical protein
MGVTIEKEIKELKDKIKNLDKLCIELEESVRKKGRKSFKGGVKVYGKMYKSS